MGYLILTVLLLAHLPTELLSILVTVPDPEVRTMLFASVILRCDYSTSANPQEVLVTWRYKSFCKDPVLEYYSTAYQAALQLGQDPSNDCPDSQRTIRTVIQKSGLNEPILGAEYRERKITIRNKADLVITEIMWWDNGVYYCSIDAPGDTTGDPDREVKLIVYHWLTVLLIIFGALMLIMLLCICCCQCCPQNCCCYVRCPCCPQTCCCPEKAVMEYRMIKEAQRAMAPWMNGQPIYAPISSAASSQGVPILYSGSFSDDHAKQNFAMGPMQLSPMALQQPHFTSLPPHPPPHHMNGSAQGSVYGTGHVLDYLENQVRGLDMVPPPQSVRHSGRNMQHPQRHLQPHPVPSAVQYTPAGPPSMLSALDELGVQGVERRVITLPPIIQPVASLSSHRGTDRARGGAPPLSSQSSGSTSRSVGVLPRSARGYRNASPPRRSILRDYGVESDWESRQGRAAHRDSRSGRGGSSARRSGGSRPRARSRDDLMNELHSKAGRRKRSYSPPLRHKESWSSDDEGSARRKGVKGRDWSERPPSYFSIENQQGRSSSRTHSHFSDRSSRSSPSIVI